VYERRSQSFRNGGFSIVPSSTRTLVGTSLNHAAGGPIIIWGGSPLQMNPPPPSGRGSGDQYSPKQRGEASPLLLSPVRLLLSPGHWPYILGHFA